MKEFYKEYFRVDENTKITDKVLVTRIGVSVFIIIFALFSMSFAAYGFFASDIASASNTVKTSRYDLDIDGVKIEKVSVASEEDTVTETPVIKNADGTYTLTAGEYKFTISRAQSENIASTGYCKIKFNADDTDVYFTEQIGKVFDGTTTTEVNSRTVTIVVYDNTNVKFIPSWGGVSFAGDPISEETDVLTPRGQQPSI